MPTTTPFARSLSVPHDYVSDLNPEAGIWTGGRWHAASGGRAFAVENPATGATITCVADGTVIDATAAAAAAAGALPGWAATAPRERSDVLQACFAQIHAAADDLAALISWENGKPQDDARAEVAYAAEFFRWFAEEAVRSDGEYGSSPAGGSRTIVTHRPVGVAALVTPWNFPAAMATRKIAPALAAGCTVVVKPAAETPLTTLAIARLLQAAGVPDGVVNVVPTTDAASVVSTWLQDDRVRKLSFTGSTPVGRILLQQAGDRVLNTSMELGGNAPFIVGPHADIDDAVAGAMVAKFRNAGQACTAANRFLVHESVAEDFTERLGGSVSALRVGSAFDEGTQVGPLISSGAVERITQAVESAIAAGARVSHCAPVPGTAAGHFFPPTVLSGVPRDAAILETEIFGPVAPVVTWASDADLLDMVNGTEMGLAAYVYSRDLGWAMRTAEAVEAGMVGINRAAISDPAAPFGGMKQSGLGREGAREGLREFQETQYFSVDWSVSR